MTTPATPRPWRVGDAGHTVFGPPRGNGAAPETVATLKGLRCGDNARLIVRAVNAHDDLVAALRAMVEDCEGSLLCLGAPDLDAEDKAAVRGHYNTARALLARIDAAKGGA